MSASSNTPRKLKELPSQTAGPYVHIGCVPTFAGLEGMYNGRDPGAVMITGDAKGERVTIEGRIFDGAGDPLKDAMLEFWQADASGLYNSPAETRGHADTAFSGWGRQPTDADTGVFRLETIRPGQVPWSDKRMQAPHISVWVVARGINLGLNTRIYFSDETEANAADPLLACVDPASRCETLLAHRDGNIWRFDIYLQGDKETVFFDV